MVMPESDKSPRKLYPGWPVSSRLGPDNLPHFMVQTMAQRLFEETQRQSTSKVARQCGMTTSTISDIVNGASWPTVETLARIEVGLGKSLWPQLKQGK